MFERGIRGGISVQTKRYAESSQDVHIEYWDANNLYGHGMCQQLPCGDFFWYCPVYLRSYLLKHNQGPEDGEYEIDLQTPFELHDDWNEYPIPEKMVITEGLISPKSRELLQGKPFIGGEKLVGHLGEKKNIVINGKLLNYLLRKGHKVTAIHRGIGYKSSAWLKPYIELNTRLRSQTTVDFERDIFKLMNNAVFGKTMEDVRKYSNFYLVRTEKWSKTVNRPDFKTSRAFGKYVSGVFRHKTEVQLNKPIYVGASVLDLSKLHMFHLHYDVVKAHFKNRAELLMTDTDSLVYEITSPDLTADLWQIREHFDFSNLPRDHPLYDASKKDQVGLLKDEFKGQRVLEFVGLRSKMYSVLDENRKTTAKAKGIPKSVTKRELPHQLYKDALFAQQPCSVTFHQIVSRNHIVEVKQQTKKALNAYDDKRYICDDGITTRAYGHYSLCND